jgi:predicted  nucleic acid-binding Zn-ribbon protein
MILRFTLQTSGPFPRLRKAQERIAAAKRPLPKTPPPDAPVPEAELLALDKKAAEVRAALEAKQALLSQVQRDYDDTAARLEALEAAKNGPSAEALRLERERQLLARIHSLQETNAGLQSERERSMDERDALLKEEERQNGGRRGTGRSLRRTPSLNQ